MSTMPDVFQTALSLPESERAELACQIILSLDPVPVSGSLPKSEKAFEEIIQARAHAQPVASTHPIPSMRRCRE